MRNDIKNTKLNYQPQTIKVLNIVASLPYFTINNLKNLAIKEYYLKIILARLEKQGKIIRLKKGLYAARTLVDVMQSKELYSDYLEFLSNIILSPSYLSLEYVLGKHNVLTDSPVNFTNISKSKTAIFNNQFGNFIYHKIKSSLFTGFKIIKNNKLIIYEATKAKAFFDYIYLRKNLIVDNRAIKELRINTDVFDKKDKQELKGYVNLEGSAKIKNIFHKILCI